MCANNFIIKVFPCNFLCLFKGTGSVLASVQWELAVRPKKLSDFLNYNFPKWLSFFIRIFGTASANLFEFCRVVTKMDNINFHELPTNYP